MRELAGWDVERYETVSNWPIREALLSFEALRKREATEQYRAEVMVYTLRAPWEDKDHKSRPPQLPDILKE